jgi:exopolyphosphatase/guanosine-5'-triphosphate,3'-diphosphate pyrophosphatase
MRGCFAVIDLGSNSVRMSITRLEEDGKFAVLEKVRETVRLSEGMGYDNFIKKEAMTRVIDTLVRFSALANEYRCISIAAIATAALRKAANRDLFLSLAKEKAGIEFEVISGEDEAYYSYLAVKETVGIKDGVIFDTGGGSTEITLVKDGEIKHSVSLPLGAVMLTEQMQRYSQMHLYKHVLSHIGTISWLDECQSLPIYGIGGSARTLAMLHKKRQLRNGELDGMKIPYHSVAKIYQEIFNTLPEKRKDIKGMDVSRADIILAGLTPAKVLMDMTGSKNVCICASGVKEGVFFRMKNEITEKEK